MRFLQTFMFLQYYENFSDLQNLYLFILQMFGRNFHTSELAKECHRSSSARSFVAKKILNKQRKKQLKRREICESVDLQLVTQLFER